MTRTFPQANYTDIVKVARKLGFSLLRQGKGSHEIWRNSNGRYTTIPKHGSKPIKRKTFKAILDSFQITPNEFSKLLKSKK
ncbi:MAG: type II toxin-antitoxin system HicA family toxin [Patescibacteria group bacterium]